MSQTVGNYAIGADYEHSILFRRLTELEERIKQLEKLVHYPVATKKDIDLKSQAAQREAVNCSAEPAQSYGRMAENLYAPLRNDTKAVLDLAAFARRLLDPQDLGHAVTFEVRQCARRALGLPEAPNPFREYV
jgi:hypothetical protein